MGLARELLYFKAVIHARALNPVLKVRLSRVGVSSAKRLKVDGLYI